MYERLQYMWAPKLIMPNRSLKSQKEELRRHNIEVSASQWCASSFRISHVIWCMRLVLPFARLPSTTGLHVRTQCIYTRQPSSKRQQCYPHGRASSVAIVPFASAHALSRALFTHPPINKDDLRVDEKTCRRKFAWWMDEANVWLSKIYGCVELTLTSLWVHVLE